MNHRAIFGTATVAAMTAVPAHDIKPSDRTGAGNDSSHIGIGYIRPLNTMLKACMAGARISNKNAAAYPVGNATDDGSGDSAFNLGLVLSF